MTGPDTEFDRDTALTRTGPSSFAGAVDPGWFIVGSANGGYVASILLRALVETVADPERPVRSLTVHYLRPAVEGPVEVETTLERSGRTLSTLSARLSQGGKPIALALAAFANSRGGGLSFQDAKPPDITPPEDTPQYEKSAMDPPIVDRLHYRNHFFPHVFGGGPAEFTTWMRLQQPRPMDAVLLATMTDAAVPAIFMRARSPLIATTVDLTVHFRDPPSGDDDWCLGRFRSLLASDGLVEEDGEIWSRDGMLLAQSRQLAIMVPLPA